MLAAERHGEGPAVVLLHGQPGSRADWRRVVPLLENEHTVIVPDRPGYGATGGAAGSFDFNADEAVRLLDAESIGSAVFVGYSWSGGVALSAAVRHPDRVGGLVLAASVRPGDEFGWSDRALAVPVVGEVIGAVTLGTTSRVLRIRGLQDLADRRLPRPAREALRALAGATGALSGVRVWRAFAAEQRLMLRDLRQLEAALGTIVVPTVVIAGGADHVVPAASGARLAASIPGAEFRLVPGARHLLPFDHPAEIADAVRSVSPRPG